MNTLTEKLKDELFSLTGKIERLTQFLESDKSGEISACQETSLILQKQFMIGYSNCLRLRIEDLENE